MLRVKDHTHVVSIMQDRIAWLASRFLEDEALGEAAQFERRQERLSNQEQKHQQRDPLPFNGDNTSEVNTMCPPLAWTLMWRGTYINLYSCYVQDGIRRWGYVMWDAARLERTDAKKVLV